MKNARAEKLIAAYLSGNSDAGEDKELMAWVDKDPESQKFFDNAVDLWNIAEEGDFPDFSTGKTKAWNRLDARLSETDQQTVSTTATIRPMYSKTWAIAASIALLLAAGWWWQTQPQSFNVQTAAAEQTMVELPDGTKVWLNENSQLAFEDTGNERSLTFEGEAYFDVATDSLKPFRIYSGRAITTVMGTAFNLRAYPNEDAVEVSVTEGKVALTKVATKNSPEAAANKIELTQGQTGVFEKEEAVVKKLDKESTQNKTAWKEQKLNFTGLTLAQVIPVIERYFKVKVDVENKDLLNCPINTGDFEQPQLEGVIEGISFTRALEASITGDVVLLKGGIPCD